MSPGLPVYKVQKDGENCVSILHHNMLLPLLTSEDFTDHGPKPVDPDGSDAGDEETYVSPITRSRVKVQDSMLALANALMDEYFDDDIGGPTTVSPTSGYHYFDLRRGCNVFFLLFK